jgi:hypothetical protein
MDAAYATTVVLTATASSAGWVHGWAGACSGMADTCAVLVSSDRLAVIRFAATTTDLGAHSNFTDPAIHVVEVMKYGQPNAYTCTKCHGATLQGSGIAPACATATCHPTTPAYPPGFVHAVDGTFGSPAAHGPGWVSSSATCGGCHGATLAGSSFTPGCSRCHPMPHVPGAKAPPNHDDLLGASLTSCSPCHEATWATSDVRLAKSCNFCHTMTHGATYTTHGLDYVANTAQCRYCHSTPQSASGTLNGGLTAPSCAAANCHSAAGTMPHATSYSDPAAHGAAYVANPLDCKGCHGTDLSGATAPLAAPSCSNCHITPHDIGAMAPPNHTTAAIAAGGTGACTACHEATSPAKLAPSCMSCHQFTHPLTWSDTPGEHGWQYGADQAVGTISCEACHGGPTLAGAVPPGTAPSCGTCHTWPVASGNHFLATAPAWGNNGSGWDQPCQRCHVSDGFRDYIGGFWGDMGILGDLNYLSGSFNGSNTTTAGTGLAGAYASGTLKCQACHNPQSEPTDSFPGITQVRFPSMNLATTDKTDGLCGQCHQGRGSTPGVNAYLNVLAASANQGLVSVTLTATGGSVGATTSTLNANGLVASAFKGFTAIFAGNVTPDLNGTTCGVVDNTTTTITLGCVLPVAPGAETVTLYPTATTGTTTSVTDSSRAWITNQWVGRYVYLYNNKGAVSSIQPPYAKITANTATSLTFATASASVVAGQFYQIVPNEAAVDGQLSGAAFQDGHNLVAAATFFGGNAAGYYEYAITWDPLPTGSATKTYLRLGSHSGAVCTNCHDAHGLAIPTTFTCGFGCHATHAGTSDQTMAGLRLKTGRWYMSGTDQGVYQNFLQMRALLYTAIQRYSLAKGNVGAGTAVICFNDGAGGDSFFLGTAEGQSDGGCSTLLWGKPGSNTAYTPRLLRAVYDYRLLVQDPGAWAHNPRYATEIMYDAIRDLNMGIQPASQINMTGWLRP